jgi:parallel beta-helix repeat protein
MKWKWLAAGIILLFIGTVFIPSTTSEISQGRKIITVDNEPGDGDYTSIKEALNHSSPGDTIEVFSGTYYEHGISIVVEGVSLIGIPHELGNGNDTGRPFINGEGKSTVFIVDVSNVTISGFHIENKGNGDMYIMDIESSSNNCNVSNNTFFYSGNSIIECGSSCCRITNNTVRWAGMYCGIGLYSGHSNFICNNIVSNCPRGIDGGWGGENYSRIIGNLVSDCSEFGIYIIGFRSELRDNTISHWDVGIISNWGKVLHNEITNNNYGIEVGPFSIVKKNNIYNNTENAWFDGLFHIWSKNYWGRPYLLPYKIKGILFSFGFPEFPYIDFPWVNFDWNPALEPYDIPGMR